jgi:hypothetical protein
MSSSHIGEVDNAVSANRRKMISGADHRPAYFEAYGVIFVDSFHNPHFVPVIQFADGGALDPFFDHSLDT